MRPAATRRVVVTGVGAISPLGNDWSSVEARLRAGRNAVTYIEEWDAYEGLNTRVGARAAAFELPADPGMRLATYTAEPGSASADALKMLASWAASADLPQPRAADAVSD